ncbi:MAG: hypothetical protein U5N85_07960 [Arcicella sp.]|nr:hypothetical protein [Arcicella sp.]
MEKTPTTAWERLFLKFNINKGENTNNGLLNLLPKIDTNNGYN